MSLKIPAGLLALIVAVPEAITENDLRRRAGGSVFVPPWNVWVYGPIKGMPKGCIRSYLLNDSKTHCVDVFGAFTFDATGLKPRVKEEKFPYAWAPRDLQAQGAWLETTKGLIINPTEETTNG